jgi:site-specific recombinase XerD
MAFADNAFESISSRADLRRVSLDSSEDLRVFPFKPHIKDKPFLVNQDGRPFSYQRFWYMLKELSYRTGYLDHIRPYDIRRGTGNALDGK